MPEANAHLMGDKGKTPYTVAEESRLAGELNIGIPPAIDPGVRALMNQKPSRKLYLYNIARTEFYIYKPPVFPHRKYAPCPEGEPYKLVDAFPDPIINGWENENRRFIPDIIDAAYAVTDLLNPAAHGRNCFAPVKDTQLQQVSGGTDDLTRRGLFWSEHNPPLPAELAEARRRLELHYKALLREGDALSRNPKTALQIGPEHHLAAEYFKGGSQRREWHIVAELPDICENCGEEIKKGAAFHKNSADVLCVRDWRRAVNAGVVKMRDVPDDKKWDVNEPVSA